MKRLRFPSPPPSAVRFLEGNPQTKLQLAHGLSAGDRSKITLRQRTGRIGSVGNIQSYHVQDIQRFSSELDIETLADFERAKDRQVHIPITGLVQEVAGGVPVNRRSPGCRRISDKRRVVEPTCRRAYGWSSGRPVRLEAVATHGIAHEPGSIRVVAIEVGIAAR